MADLPGAQAASVPPSGRDEILGNPPALLAVKAHAADQCPLTGPFQLQAVLNIGPRRF